MATETLDSSLGQPYSVGIFVYYAAHYQVWNRPSYPQAVLDQYESTKALQNCTYYRSPKQQPVLGGLANYC
jgi:hypothetical protein